MAVHIVNRAVLYTVLYTVLMYYYISLFYIIVQFTALICVELRPTTKMFSLIYDFLFIEVAVKDNQLSLRCCNGAVRNQSCQRFYDKVSVTKLG